MSKYSLHPTQSKCLLQLAATLSYDDDNDTVIASNCTTEYKQVECANAIAIATLHAIATSILIMKGTPAKNLHQSDNPITISLPDGRR